MFILVKGLDEIDISAPHLATPELRFRRLMETAGLSTIIVGLTNVVSFLWQDMQSTLSCCDVRNAGRSLTRIMSAASGA